MLVRPFLGHDHVHAGKERKHCCKVDEGNDINFFLHLSLHEGEQPESDLRIEHRQTCIEWYHFPARLDLQDSENMWLKKLGFCFVVTLVSSVSTLRAEGLPVADNLLADSQHAAQASVPILLLYTASYCHYCASVKAEVYYPMNADPAYQTRAVTGSGD